MGYEFHITRAENWAESDQRPITAEEWLAGVGGDPELHIDEQSGAYFAVWSGPCSYPGGAWFDWSDGQIFTKNPDQAILAKMLQLADRLEGVVQGDDGEIYRDASQISNGRSAQELSVRRWDRFLRVAGVAIVILAVCVLARRLILWLSG
jgi:hypothetical protein